jgi:hypothetical protein
MATKCVKENECCMASQRKQLTPENYVSGSPLVQPKSGDRCVYPQHEAEWIGR